MSTYREWQPSLHPTSLAGRWGSAWGAALGAEKDRLRDLAVEAVTVRGLPEGDRAALDAGGADRGIPRLAGEGLDAYRDRLRGAWESWSWAGTPRGIREVIVLGTLGEVSILPNRTMPRPPSTAYWARYTLVFTGRPVWDAGTSWDDDVGWDGRSADAIEVFTETEVRQRLYPLLRQWSSARDRVTSVIVARGSYLWDTEDTWDSPITWDGGDTASEDASRPWDDTASEWDSPFDAWDYFC